MTLGRGLDTTIYRAALTSTSACRVFLVFDANFHALHGPTLERKWRGVARETKLLVIPSGEKFKTREAVARIQDWAISEGASPDDILIACGGGVTSDIVGFAAATLFRGIKWGICSSTLLGIVDASIGGKTGINLDSGKNLVGAFWQPSFVIDDLNWLETLPNRELNSGIAEIVKCAGLKGGSLLRRISKWAQTGFDSNHGEAGKLIGGVIRYKGEIVLADERDRGRRLILNYGHTVGHAIEQSLEFQRLTHGEAVLLGMLVAAEIENALGIGDPGSLGEFRAVVASVAVTIPKVRLSSPAIMQAMETDKKRRRGRIRMVLLRRPGTAVIREVDPKIIRRALATVISKYGRQ